VVGNEQQRDPALVTVYVRRKRLGRRSTQAAGHANPVFTRAVLVPRI